MRKAFTLIELMIAIVILSIIMVFLYKSYAELNLQNKVYETQAKEIKHLEQIKRVLFLDFALSLSKSVHILPQDPKTDIVFLQSSHSIHNRINPYVGYIVKDKRLYRIESLTALQSYPLDLGVEFDVDELGEVENFRIYQGKKDSRAFISDLLFSDKQRILMKIKSLES